MNKGKSRFVIRIVPGTFFNASFLKANGLVYLPGIPYLEDGEFMTRVICLANRVTFINKYLYVRTTRIGSATNSKMLYTEKARNGFLLAANNLLNFKNSHCRTEEQSSFMNQSIIHFTILTIITLDGMKLLKHYSALVRILKSGPLSKLETDGCSQYYKQLGNSYNKSVIRLYLRWIGFKIRKSLQLRLKRLARLVS